MQRCSVVAVEDEGSRALNNDLILAATCRLRLSQASTCFLTLPFHDLYQTVLCGACGIVGTRSCDRCRLIEVISVFVILIDIKLAGMLFSSQSGFPKKRLPSDATRDWSYPSPRGNTLSWSKILDGQVLLCSASVTRLRW